MIRTYSELITFRTFKDRFEYLRLNGSVGRSTFGFDRVFNQMFYKSTEWRRLRNEIITRDRGLDLGLEGYEIPEGVNIYIHHMNPIEIHDIIDATEFLMNPEFLITTIHNTHNGIHYGDYEAIERFYEPVVRSRNDTCPWKKN